MVQFDIKTAFLHGDLDEELYMLQPEGFKDGSGKVYKLLRSLYGLKQSPLQWHKKIDSVLAELDMKTTNYDRCVYTNEERLANRSICGRWSGDRRIDGQSQQIIATIQSTF